MQLHHPRATWLDPNAGRILEPQVLLQKMAQKQLVLLGENHDVTEIHRWQLYVITALHTLRQDIVVGFEMFPKSAQAVLDEWVSGALSTEEFIEKSKWYEVWGFPADIYLPIFHFCRMHKVKMLGLNCSRGLVRRVGQVGWEQIPEDEREGLTPAAPAQETYVDHLRGLIQKNSIPTASIENFVRAQQTWDRTFACNLFAVIEEAQKNNEPTPLLIGVLGRGHTDYGYGTPYQLRDLGVHDIGILATQHEQEFDLEKNKGIADAVFRIDMPEPKAVRQKR